MRDEQSKKVEAKSTKKNGSNLGFGAKLLAAADALRNNMDAPSTNTLCSG